MEQTDKDVNGWVSIQNGNLHVEDPQPGGKPAVISADDSVSVYLDEHPIYTPTEVFARTSLRIQLPFKTYPEYHCDFEIAQDLCSVALTVQQHSPGHFYALADTLPTPFLRIEAAAREAPLSAFKDEIREEIIHELKARRVKVGILPEQIEQAIEQPGTAFKVVQSTPPLSPENRLEYFYALPEPDPDNPRGFKLSFPVLRICKANEVIIQRHISTHSQAGINIYGETIVPEQPKARPLKAADRTVIVDPEENQAKARLEGVPSFNGREARIGTLDRRSEVVLGGPGAIYDIKGSMQIDSSVSNNAQIWVSQHLEISGDVSHSHLEAQEHLIVHGNVIRSQLSAGGDAAARMRLRQPVEHLYAQMEQILQYFRQVQRAMARARALDDKQLFLRVIKSHFPQLQDELTSLWNLNQSLRQLHPRRTMVLKVVLANLMNLADRTMDERSFIDWLDSLKTFLEDLLQLDPLSTHVYLNYAQGSHIVSRGNLYLMGEGCYNSELQAGGDIVFCGSPGYCREGSLKAEGNIYVPELGSPNGSRLKVSLELTSLLRVQHMHPGVELQFGAHLQHHNLETRRNVEARVHNGQIVFNTNLHF